MGAPLFHRPWWYRFHITLLMSMPACIKWSQCKRPFLCYLCPVNLTGVKLVRCPGVMKKYMFNCWFAFLYRFDISLSLRDVIIAGVYTRNRNFRLLLSTKLGKASGELRVARANQFMPRSSVSDGSPAKRARLQQRAEDDVLHCQSMEQTFLDSLICNVEYVSPSPLSLLLFYYYLYWNRT